MIRKIENIIDRDEEIVDTILLNIQVCETYKDVLDAYALLGEY